MESITTYPTIKCNKEIIKVPETHWKKFDFDGYYCADLAKNSYKIRGQWSSINSKYVAY